MGIDTENRNQINDKSIEQSNDNPAVSMPIISHNGRETFTHNGRTYLSHPTLPEALVEAGITNLRVFKALVKELQFQDIHSFEDMVNVNKSQLLQSLHGNKEISTKLFTHITRVKHQGPILLSTADLLEREKEYYYLEFVKGIDAQLFRNSNGKEGIRSKSIVEICGPSGAGKTQWCLTAVSSMLQVGKKIVYVDSEGGFDLHRLQQISTITTLSRRSLNENVILSKIDSFDELDLVLDQISELAQNNNIGMIVIDSLMELLQNSYPITSTHSMDYVAERQLHLRRTLRRLRLMARQYNLIIIYTNYTKGNSYNIPVDLTEDVLYQSIDDEVEELAVLTKLLRRLVLTQVPMGGATLAQSADMRIFLGYNHDKQGTYRALIQNCSYLPMMDVNFAISKRGIELIDQPIEKDQDTEINKSHIDQLNDNLG